MHLFVNRTLLLLLFPCIFTYIYFAIHTYIYGFTSTIGNHVIWENPVSKHHALKCGYKSCTPVKEGYLNVHVIPHTHDDVGWLKTVDQYYYGSKTPVQFAGVQFILDSVIVELAKDPNKRFVYVEMAFFWKWWLEQSESTRNTVRDLVESGQLEFIGGAWSMNDEATCNYMSIIDQFTWGLRKLNDIFGECGRPRIGWQIDPFGHSRQMATIFSQLGYDGLFFNRIDHQDKSQRQSSKSMEMIWQSSPNLGLSADIFTHVLHGYYWPTDGFCFDISCKIDPIVDDINSPEYNVEPKANKLINLLLQQANAFQNHSNVILLMGGDFYYQDANYYFKSLDKLIKHINSKQASGSKINVIYSTPSCYLKAINDQNIVFPTKQDDFFPYKSENVYWTGYYTSRPTLKYYERKGNNYLQTCKQLSVQSLMGSKYESKITPLRETMGVMQHHDAITGTEKQYVAYDYARLLSEGIENCEKASYTIISEIANSSKTSEFKTCQLLNISQCEVSEQCEQFLLTLYNPLSRPVTEFVRLPIPSETAFDVIDSNGEKLIIQFVPLPSAVLRIPGRKSSVKTELVFRADNLPPLGYKSYLITKNKHYLKNQESKSSPKSDTDNPTHIGDKSFGLKIDIKDSRNFVLFIDNKEISIIQEYLYYESNVGFPESSGAYIFQPQGVPISVWDNRTLIKHYPGPIVQEIHQEINEWVSQVIRKYNGEDHIEFEWLVGSLPNEDRIGKEVISRFRIPFYQSNQTFYTDSNGREMLKRVLDQRSSFNLSNSVASESGNYYPVTSRISLTDSHTRFSVLNDRSQGGSSFKDGEIELMVHRRMFHDDNCGVNETLDENAFGVGLVARGQHYLTFGSADKQFLIERLLAQRKLIRPQYFFTILQNVVSHDELKNSNLLQYSGLKKSLPNNVQLLTLEPWKDGSVLIRFEHIFEYNEDINLSKPVVLDVQDLFTKFRIVSLKETTLGGNQWLSENIKLKWMAEKNNFQNRRQSTINDQIFVNPKNIVLSPMQIRSFVAEITPYTE